MPFINGKKVTPFPGLKLKARDAQRDAVIQFDDVNTAPTTATGYYYLYVDNGKLYYDDGTQTYDLTFGGGGGISSWDGLYASDKTLTLNSTTLTFSLTHATNDGLTITGSAGSAGDCIQITNAGTGSDIEGTSGTWSVSKTGAAVFTSITGIDSFTAAANLALEATGAGTISIGATSSGAIDIGTGGGAITLATATTASLGLTVTAGGILSSDGIVDVVDNSNAASSFRVTNDTITTYGNASDAGMVVFRSESLTTAALLHLSVDETGMAGGYFLRCWSQDAGAAAFTIGELGATVIAGSATGTAALTVTAGNVLVSDGATSFTNSADTTTLTIVADAQTTGNVIDVNADAITTGTLLHLDTTAATFSGKYIDCYDGAASDFTVGLYGATLIAGNAGSNMLTVAAGDVSVADGSLIMVDADNAASLSVTNDFATSESVFVFAGSGVYTGSTTKSFMTLTPSGLTTGTALYIPTAGLTTGKVVNIVAGAATDGVLVDILGGGANMSATGGIATFNMGAATDGAGLRISTSGVYTGAGLIQLTANSATTGNIVDINAAGLTEGTAIKITATEATLTSGMYLEFYDGAANDFSVAKYGATVIAGNALGTAALTLTAGDACVTSGNVIITAGALITPPQEISNDNTAIDLVHGVTTIGNNAPSTHTLADGTVGQHKTIVCTTYVGNAVITPDNLANGTTITLNAVNDGCDLIFLGTEWVVTNLYGTAAVA